MSVGHAKFLEFLQKFPGFLVKLEVSLTGDPRIAELEF